MKSVRILWDNGVHEEIILASHARVLKPEGAFKTESLTVVFEDEKIGFGADTTLVHVQSNRDAFSFLLRDVKKEYPIYVPKCHAAVTEEDDERTFAQIVSDIRAGGRMTRMQRMEAEEEYSYDQAAAETRDLPGLAWLGISKDMGFFEVGLRSKSCGNDEETYDYIRPRYFDALTVQKLDPAVWTDSYRIPEMNGEPELKYSLFTGRGIGCKHEVTKRLEEGWMPILNARNEDEGIEYTEQFFGTQETSPLDQEHICGTEFFAAHAAAYGHNMTDEQQSRAKEALEREIAREEKAVMYVRVTARNTTDAPLYAFVLAPDPIPGWDWSKPVPKFHYDADRGCLCSESTGRVMCLCALNGKPMPQAEMSLLLSPGEKAVFEYKIPFLPIPRERAEKLALESYDARLAQAKDFWREEAERGARVTLPEKRIEEMIKAGLLHMDVGYFGKNPDGPVDPIVGVYTAIGSESSPGIQFLDAMGHNELAKRAIQFFMELQHDDGFIQNYEGYMLETGCVLWTMGEHYRMTRDLKWVSSVRDNILRACDYLINWRNQNKLNEYKNGNGFGMISGRVSDPMDFFHSFMLNAGTYAGLARSAEMLGAIGDPRAEEIGHEAEALKADILESYRANLAKSPVLPARDGTWYRASAPWPEYAGPLSLYAQGGHWFTDLFTDHDIEGAMYLVLNGVIGPHDPLCGEIVKFYAEHLTLNNTSFNQSYYSPHPYAHALRGEVKPFLKEFYSGFTSLADREIYTFWETYGATMQNKLHEETWFLMRCRWMLCVEDTEKRELKLLSVAPRAWLKQGAVIEVKEMRCAYGILSYRVESDIERGIIKASVTLAGDGYPIPDAIALRLPHPTEGVKARYSSAGVYDAQRESVILPGRKGAYELELYF